MAITRKRKHVTANDQPSGKQSKQQSIGTFGTIVKQHVNDLDGKKRKLVHPRESTPEPALTTKTVSNPDLQRKRRRSRDTADHEDETVMPRCKNGPEAKRVMLIVPTSDNSGLEKTTLPSISQTPSAATAALFDRLRIDSRDHAIPCALSSKQRSVYTTPPDTPPSEEDPDHLCLPPELEDLRALYSSFLAALSLYRAHNGASQTVDTEAFLPMVTKLWKKRKVELKDLQLLLAILPEQERVFLLEDFGRAGIFITRSQASNRIPNNIINEEELRARFEHALRRSWYETAREKRNPSSFLSSLPLLGIVINERVDQTSSLFARGQQRLADLKGAATASSGATASSSRPQTQAPLSTTTTTHQSRGTALLDRILAKQHLASALPAGPSRSQIERKAALHRIEDVARVLSLLVAGGGTERCSLSLPAVTQRLQQSLRSPIAAEEVRRCLDLLSAEIAPALVRVVRSGEVQGVVVARAGMAALPELRARVERALAEC